MSEIKINYDEVYNKARELRNRLSNELRDMASNHRQIQSSLMRMDGKTNAELTETCELNQAKAQAAVDTLQHLITFIEQSARAMEQEEQAIRRVFDQSTLQSSRPAPASGIISGGAN